MTLVPEPEGCASKLMKALRVLVVEDDALIAMLLTEMLAGMGHDVCATAATEADAVSAATRYDPDLMIWTPAWVGAAAFPLSRKYSERGLSHTCSSAAMLEECGCASRMQWLS